MNYSVLETISCCHQCQVEKPFHKRTTYQLVKPRFAGRTIFIDVVGPLPISTNWSKYIIVAIDHLTGWVEARAINDLGTVTTSKFIMECVVQQHGCLQFILTDNGTNFTLHILPKLNELMAIRGVLTTPYHPESNVMVEQVNGTLVNILHKLLNDGPSEWSALLPTAVFTYNISYHSSTGKSPFQLLYGGHPALPALLYSCVEDIGGVNPQGYLKQHTDTLIKLQMEAYSTSLAKKICDQAADQKRQSRLPLFAVGDYILFHDQHVFERKNKLSNIWVSPIEIVKKTGMDVYTIKEPAGGWIINGVHTKFLGAYKQ